MPLGKIIPRKMRLRRSSKLMHHDPYTLVIAPDSDATATGTLYKDDEITLAHEITSSYIYRQFEFTKNVLKCHSYIWDHDETSTHSKEIVGGIKSTTLSTAASTAAKEKVEFHPLNTVERIEILGQDKQAKGAKLTIVSSKTGETIVKMLTVNYDSVRKVNTIKKPDVLVAEDWTIELLF